MGTSSQWIALPNKTIIIINNNQELDAHIIGNDFPAIDFSRQTLLLVNFQSPAIVYDLTKNIWKFSRSEYELNMEIRLSSTLSIINRSRHVTAILIPKMNDESRIDLNVSIFQNEGHPYVTTISQARGFPHATVIRLDIVENIFLDVITTPEAWSAFLENTPRLRLTETTIDFSKYQIIVAIDRLRGGTGSDIEIISITEHSEEIVVVVRDFFRSSIASVTTQAHHIIKMPRSDKNVRFELIEQP
ncbi:MAG: hypothetical protein FWC94_00660 [Bacteroidales bacterium]|nr:hypothetical protein [Bacteroidales bacterium]